MPDLSKVNRAKERATDRKGNIYRGMFSLLIAYVQCKLVGLTDQWIEEDSTRPNGHDAKGKEKRKALFAGVTTGAVNWLTPALANWARYGTGLAENKLPIEKDSKINYASGNTTIMDSAFISCVKEQILKHILIYPEIEPGKTNAEPVLKRGIDLDISLITTLVNKGRSILMYVHNGIYGESPAPVEDWESQVVESVAVVMAEILESETDRDVRGLIDDLRISLDLKVTERAATSPVETPSAEQSPETPSAEQSLAVEPVKPHPKTSSIDPRDAVANLLSQAVKIVESHPEVLADKQVSECIEALAEAYTIPADDTATGETLNPQDTYRFLQEARAGTDG